MDLSKKSLTELKQMIEKYNLHHHIKGYPKASKKKLQEIANDLTQYLHSLETHKSKSGGDVPTAEEKKEMRNKFVQMKNQLDNNAIQKNNEFYDGVNEQRKLLTARKEFQDNQAFVISQREKRQMLKDFWTSLYNILEQNGWKKDSGESIAEFSKRFENKTGYSLHYIKKNGKYQWSWLNTKEVPTKIEDFGVAGTILKKLGLEGVANSLLNLHNSTAKVIDKPSIKGVIDVGKAGIEVVKQSKAIYDTGIKGTAKTAVKNVAKTGFS
jgi:hypothetical protein